MNPLIIQKDQTQNAVAIYKEIPEEILWNQNFNSDNTIDTYKKAIETFLTFLGIATQKELREITHAHIIAFKKSLQEKGMSPRTINNRLSALSSLFDHLIDKQIVKINPVQGTKRLKVNNDRVESKVLSPHEVRKMLDSPQRDTLQGLRDRAILHILFFSGCRISEVCSLKVKDFYEEQGFFLLDFWVKGGKKNRIAINQELQIALTDYLKEAGHGNDPESFLILPVKNNQKAKDLSRKLSRFAVHFLWERYAMEAGIKGTRPHSARATFITQALENNCPIEAVQRSVGHSQIKTTQMYDKRTTKYRESASFSVRY